MRDVEFSPLIDLSGSGINCANSDNLILVHPKVKLFMSHGGLLGINEAVYAGVPILGIPIFADQSTNVNSLKRLGAAEILNYDKISKELVLEKMMQILSNARYLNSIDYMSQMKIGSSQLTSLGFTSGQLSENY